jgi:hemolysin-activating ACP:hemolysin acyltransferase
MSACKLHLSLSETEHGTKIVLHLGFMVLLVYQSRHYGNKPILRALRKLITVLYSGILLNMFTGKINAGS